VVANCQPRWRQPWIPSGQSAKTEIPASIPSKIAKSHRVLFKYLFLNDRQQFYDQTKVKNEPNNPKFNPIRPTDRHTTARWSARNPPAVFFVSQPGAFTWIYFRAVAGNFLIDINLGFILFSQALISAALQNMAGRWRLSR